MHTKTTMKFAGATLLKGFAMAGSVVKAVGASADNLLLDSNQALQQIDAAQDGALWSNAASFVEAKIEKPKFIARRQQQPQLFDKVAARDWAAITRERYVSDCDVPGGRCANIDYDLRTIDGQKVFELVSFQWVPGGERHLTCYNVRRDRPVNPTVEQSALKS